MSQTTAPSLARSLFLFVALAALGGETWSREGAPGPADPKSAKLVEEGDLELAAQRYAQAIEAYEKADRRSGGTLYPAQIGLARAYRALGDNPSAARWARLATQTAGDDTDEAQAYNLLGLVLLEESHARRAVAQKEALEEAESAFLRVLELLGDRANAARLDLARVLRTMQRYPEALAVVEEYLEVAPQESGLAGELREHLRCVMDRRDDGAEQVSGSGSEQPPEAETEARAAVEAPLPISRPPPVYPRELRAERLEGQVLIEALIEPTGEIACPWVLESPHPAFSEAALTAVRRWTFEPARKDGEPVQVFYNLRVNFRLRTRQ